MAKRKNEKINFKKIYGKDNESEDNLREVYELLFAELGFDYK